MKKSESSMTMKVKTVLDSDNRTINVLGSQDMSRMSLRHAARTLKSKSPDFPDFVGSCMHRWKLTPLE